MNYVRNGFQHFVTITRHRLLVMQLCFKVGLYKQGLMHDLSKYSPAEFLTGVKHYQGTRSPNTAEREKLGYSPAWLHHKGRNKHHFEYWIDFSLRTRKMEGVEMPANYLVEMFMDRIAACKIYNGENYKPSDALDYHMRGVLINEYIHPNTRALLEKLLKMLAQYGEEKTFHYIKKNVLKNYK